MSSSQNENGSKSIDISELQRVYGNLKLKNENVMTVQNDNQIRQLLQQENVMLKKLLDEKENHIASLKQAMILLEHKEQQKEKSNSWLSKLFRW